MKLKMVDVESKRSQNRTHTETTKMLEYPAQFFEVIESLKPVLFSENPCPVILTSVFNVSNGEWKEKKINCSWIIKHSSVRDGFIGYNSENWSEKSNDSIKNIENYSYRRNLFLQNVIFGFMSGTVNRFPKVKSFIRQISYNEINKHNFLIPVFCCWIFWHILFRSRLLVRLRIITVFISWPIGIEPWMELSRLFCCWLFTHEIGYPQGKLRAYFCLRHTIYLLFNNIILFSFFLFFSFFFQPVSPQLF